MSAKRIRFGVLAAEHGEGWAVLLLEDREERLYVVAWDAAGSAGRQEANTRDLADYFFGQALRRVA